MSLPKKSCVHCGNDLSLATDVKPGLCPNCGHPWAVPRRHPLDAGDCAWAAFTCCLLIFLANLAWKKEVNPAFGMSVFLIGAPNFFLGFFTAGFFSRTGWAQLLWGALLGAVFGGMSGGLIYAVTRRM